MVLEETGVSQSQRPPLLAITNLRFLGDDQGNSLIFAAAPQWFHPDAAVDADPEGVDAAVGVDAVDVFVAPFRGVCAAGVLAAQKETQVVVPEAALTGAHPAGAQRARRSVALSRSTRGWNKRGTKRFKVRFAVGRWMCVFFPGNIIFCFSPLFFGGGVLQN